MSFTPTYLYIKQHTVTGKLYFGKTTRNPEKYLGSGKHWTRHIRKHGKEYVVNLWYELFNDPHEIQEFALSFSTAMDIVESNQWLNLIPENGLSGGKTVYTHRTYTKIPGVKNGTKFETEHKNNISINNGSKLRCSCLKCKREIPSMRLLSHVCLGDIACKYCNIAIHHSKKYCSRSCRTTHLNLLHITGFGRI